MKKSRKSLFIHTGIFNLKVEQLTFYYNLQRVVSSEIDSEIIGYLPGIISIDSQIRPLIISKDIVNKIECDHGPICLENIIINAHEWEYATTNVLGNPDKINLIKHIPNSNNYLLIAATRINGFYMLTHFETETSGDVNLKRIPQRGNVISRGPSIGL